MRTWQDGVGNVHGRIDGRNRDAPALLCGSHYDTVMDAGKYDGALGIIVAIASVKATILQVCSSQFSPLCSTEWFELHGGVYPAQNLSSGSAQVKSRLPGLISNRQRRQCG